MDSIVEENGHSSNNIDERSNNLITTRQIMQQQQTTSNLGGGGVVGNIPASVPVPNMPTSATASVLTSTANVVQYLPAASHGMQSVIQAANQSSVIQSAVTNSITKGAQTGGVLYMNKTNASTVIHTTSANTVQIKPEPPTQQLDSNSEDSYTDEDSPRRQKDLTRRPSYHKIFNEISGPDISDNSVIAEDQTRKREIRLQKNREAARECRRKKKEYIKCLENRVAVLENQNKALIEELKSLKELYCQTKND